MDRFRMVALGVGAVGLAAALVSLVLPKSPVGDGAAAIVRTPIAAPESADAWAVIVARCINRGPAPEGVKWYVARLPRDPERLLGLADFEANSITLDSSFWGYPREDRARIIRHELAHLIGGWKAQHPVAAPTNRVDRTEPRAYFNQRCRTL